MSRSHIRRFQAHRDAISADRARSLFFGCCAAPRGDAGQRQPRRSRPLRPYREANGGGDRRPASRRSHVRF